MNQRIWRLYATAYIGVDKELGSSNEKCAVIYQERHRDYWLAVLDLDQVRRVESDALRTYGNKKNEVEVEISGTFSSYTAESGQWVVQGFEVGHGPLSIGMTWRPPPAFAGSLARAQYQRVFVISCECSSPRGRLEATDRAPAGGVQSYEKPFRAAPHVWVEIPPRER